MAGIVLVDDQRVEKSSEQYPLQASIRIKGAEDPTARYVGRGGLKLEGALRSFNLDVSGMNCLDVGASTGGFTDCLLQNNVKKVWAIDVGHNQIDWRLRTDPRVEVREGVNARYLQPSDFPVSFDLAVIDVSFISVKLVLPAIVQLMKDDGRVITLIKPQFEVGRGQVGSGGIVRDEEQHRRVVAEVNALAESIGLHLVNVIDSPILGAEGNKEFLALYSR